MSAKVRTDDVKEIIVSRQNIAISRSRTVDGWVGSFVR